MDIIDLGSAERRAHHLPFEEFPYPASKITYLPVPEGESSEPFFEVLDRRATRREFGGISQENLSSLLWHAAKVKSSKILEAGHVWQHRPAPSAGGRHPLDLLIITRINRELQVQIYDPIAHALKDLNLPSPRPMENLIRFLQDNFETGQAVILWFAAQVQKTTSVYRNATGLIYRDAGALEATVALAAEALGLNYCSIGITGEPWISNSLGSEGLVCGVGGMLVGDPC